MTGVEEGAAIAALAEGAGTAAAAEGAAAGGTALAAEGALGSAALDAAATDALWNAGTAGLLEYGGGYEGANMLATQGLLDSAALNTLEGASAMEVLQPVMNEEQAAELLRQQGMQGLQDYGVNYESLGNAHDVVKGSLTPMERLQYGAQGMWNNVTSNPQNVMRMGQTGMNMMNRQPQQQGGYHAPSVGGGMDSGGGRAQIQSFAGFSPYAAYSNFGKGFSSQPMKKKVSGLL